MSPADWKWPILSVVYYRSWMECAGVTRTSQNGRFFIKSTFVPQWTEHPHGICLLVNLVHSASPDDWKLWSIGVVYYRSGMKCAVLVRTSQNGPFFIKSMFLPHWYSLIIVHLWLSFQDSDSTYLEIINKLVERLSLQPLNHFCVWSFSNEPYIFTRR